MKGSSRFLWAQGSPGQSVTKGRVQGKPGQVLIVGDMSQGGGRAVAAASSGEIWPCSVSFLWSPGKGKLLSL